ncbi:uncharacterized protein LOC103475158 isoform X1 [Poecilia reticulata]|uniref:uncharacterized protein LOC103475158 isoform X1 n=1 Tax=Poecilia reticulata TaxID=8081 RepID=UPI0004A2B268|nr:PREDICTED: uncharacterized protein LOC103475158 isoform X1 [Poecilia reticulata]
MRPTTGAMLQQNNNNNYPCLGMSDCPQEMLQRCSRTSLPFPSRVELGLRDLPLIRGLRAWALCSRNRRKAGGLLGGGKPPTAPPLGGRGTSTSCPRPADVYLSGYGLPLGVDARQAGIGALVTVATLKTSEGGGKTQTQCLFLRTEKGSCLYSTTKPGSGSTSSTVGEWLRGKREGLGGGGSAEPPPTEAAANRVRVRSGRRFRKSGIGWERGFKTAEGKQSERVDVPPETRTQKNSKDDREEAESPTRRTAIELELDGKEAEELDSKNDSAVDGEKLSERLQERQNSPIPDSKSKQNEAEPHKEMVLNSVESSIPLGGAGPNAEEEIQLNAVESSIPVGGVGQYAEEIQLTSVKSSIPVRGAEQNPEEETEQEVQLISVESSIPVGGADQDIIRVYSNQNQRKVEHEEETNISSDEETREPHVFQKREEINNFQEEEVVFCSPVRQKNLSISEKSEKLKDECTCGKQEDEEENTSTLVFNASSNPAPSLASMATSGEEEEEEEGSQKQSRRPTGELEEKAEEVRVSSTEEEEEDEFGVFMQAEGDPVWSDGVNMSASETSGSRARTAAGGDDTWTAFPQEPTGESGGGVERWWPANAVEARRDGPPTNHSLVAVFAEAFPSLPGVSPGDPCDLEAFPTLTQLLRGRARQDQGLLDSFHDLNKMIDQSHKRSSSASQNLLVQTLQLQPPLPESRSTSWSTNRRLSPGLSSANQHVAAKRRLSYDYNRNVVA